MNEIPTPPDGYQLAERGKVYRFPIHLRLPPNLIWSIYEGRWVSWADIYLQDWRDWPNGTPTDYAVPLEVSSDS